MIFPKACSLSVHGINSLLPSGGERIKLLEVRYVCPILNNAALEREALSISTNAGKAKYIFRYFKQLRILKKVK